MKSSPLRLIVSVLVTCVIAAASLAATYSVTAPLIAAQDKAAEVDALKTVLPEAVSFEPVDAATLKDAEAVVSDEKVDAVYRALDGSSVPIGWGIKVASRGYGGYINMVLGLDSDGKVTGLTILSMNETPGLGSRVKSEPWFLGQFLKLKPGYTEKDVKSLDTISGATKSSRGVRNSVIAAGLIYEKVLKQAGEIR
ncbi:MAG: FMN-binding protein [Actinomycetia bacterium]|nr:FMN-binding protein [Actinomycetes bacterium]